MPLISIIVNHHQTVDLLTECLKSIVKNTAVINREIIVVDSQAQESTEALIRKNINDVIYLPFVENIGFAKSVNAGIRKSIGEYILILNADTVLSDARSIPAMIECLESDKSIGLLGPCLLNDDGTVQKSAFRFYAPQTLLCRRTLFGKTRIGKKIIGDFLMNDFFGSGDGDIKIKSPIEVGWVMGAALFTSRSALNKIGVLDERFFMYFEDVDWARRFWENGLKVVYCAGAKICHHHQRASKKQGIARDLLFNPYARIHLSSAVKYFMKYKFKIIPFK